MGQAVHSERRTEPHLQLDKDDEWLDEALRDTFPAIDPIPRFIKSPRWHIGAVSPRTDVAARCASTTIELDLCLSRRGRGSSVPKI